ncbi:uncharacterized protein DUF3108 [Rhodopseudomonas thermotolerans]|uniref:Uncharacterized protein DUF3108 n=2 Tax=Rhodopseudomonas TaxID=1073 RepID=A0A336K134_9BRAD|nr:uncharacterized protein DUF3108 [Rhodopseudomonas pentothenatexigens]REF92839.1 uncharacterized protein DUF3108 [Rhodopseudomonas thermotolerans]SSW91941.1 uncharacterized protein DUF3108 [Rhodopseudomonas pentothenatexigens]
MSTSIRRLFPAIRRAETFAWPLTFVALVAAAEPAAAQATLDARYEASLAGIEVGKGAWVIQVDDNWYSASASGATSGVMQAFSSGHGRGESQGRVVNGQLVPSSYTASITGGKKTETIRITLANGNVKDSSIEPEPPPDDDRIPVTDAHRRGVIDPMTASFLRVPGTGDLLSPESCRISTPIFDGRMRYDLRLEYKRTETIKAEKGYRGPALVCAVYFNPVSGYIPDRAAIKYLIKQRDMEVWLAPIAGTRVLAPYKLKIPTPLGNAVLEATQFVTEATPPKSASRGQ